MGKWIKRNLYILRIFFRDENLQTEQEHYETYEQAKKRKEELLNNKDEWFLLDDIESVIIDDSPTELEVWE